MSARQQPASEQSGASLSDKPLFERIHTSFMSNPERQLMRYIAERLPSSVMPDHLTAFGVFGSFVVMVGYIGAHLHPAIIWVANLGLVLHWLGDSLDGTVARVRHIERPGYGYFLDQTIDVVTNLLIALGVGLSPYARLDTALLVLAGYHMISIYVFVRNVVVGEFHVAVYGLGPTEMRIGIVVMNVLITILGATTYTFHGISFTWCDILMVATFFLLFGIFVSCIYTQAIELSKPDWQKFLRQVVKDRVRRRKTMKPPQ